MACLASAGLSMTQVYLAGTPLPRQFDTAIQIGDVKLAFAYMVADREQYLIAAGMGEHAKFEAASMPVSMPQHISSRNFLPRANFKGMRIVELIMLHPGPVFFFASCRRPNSMRNSILGEGGKSKTTGGKDMFADNSAGVRFHKIREVVQTLMLEGLAEMPKMMTVDDIIADTVVSNELKKHELGSGLHPYPHIPLRAPTTRLW